MELESHSCVAIGEGGNGQSGDTRRGAQNHQRAASWIWCSCGSGRGTAQYAPEVDGSRRMKTTAIYANALGEEERAIAARMFE